MVKIDLWSIKDYQSFFLRDQGSLIDLYSEKFLELQTDYFHAFIFKQTDLTDFFDSFKGKTFPVPISIKDNICTRDFPTTCGSKMLENWYPEYDASIVKFLRSEGFFLIGKTNLDEFAMGNTTATSYFGPSFNPWDVNKEFSPGGSSGGAAVSVACGYCPTAIGSDTGGSLRCPASWTGVLGLKPTYGRVSRFGLVSYAHTLDQIGIIGRYAEDISKILQIISKPDPNDMTYRQHPYIHTNLAIDRPITIGIAQDIFSSSPSDQLTLYHNSLQIIDSIPEIELVEVKLEDLEILLPTYYVTAMGEAYSNLSRYTGEHYGFSAGEVALTRLQGFGIESLRRIKMGSYVLQKGYDQQLYAKAQDIREHYKSIFGSLFSKYPIIALPTMPDFALRWDDEQTIVENYQSDLYTVLANLIGIPALSIPIGFGYKHNVKLPLGLQLLGDWWTEELLLKVAWEFQQKTNYHLQLTPKPKILEENYDRK
ncbi:MAG: amidase family protein [Candidatus Thorarchaeota archaeon]